MADLISRPLIEITRAPREKRLTVQELVEVAIAKHERFGERLHANSLWTPDRSVGPGSSPSRAWTPRR
jgi:hypothetical protein